MRWDASVPLKGYFNCEKREILENREKQILRIAKGELQSSFPVQYTYVLHSCIHISVPFI